MNAPDEVDGRAEDVRGTGGDAETVDSTDDADSLGSFADAANGDAANGDVEDGVSEEVDFSRSRVVHRSLGWSGGALRSNQDGYALRGGLLWVSPLWMSSDEGLAYRLIAAPYYGGI